MPRVPKADNPLHRAKTPYVAPPAVQEAKTNDEKAFICKWLACQSPAVNDQVGERHEKIHQLNAYTCNVCGGWYPREDALNRHTRKHCQGDPPDARHRTRLGVNTFWENIESLDAAAVQTLITEAQAAKITIWSGKTPGLSFGSTPKADFYVPPALKETKKSIKIKTTTTPSIPLSAPEVESEDEEENEDDAQVITFASPTPAPTDDDPTDSTVDVSPPNTPAATEHEISDHDSDRDYEDDDSSASFEPGLTDDESTCGDCRGCSGADTPVTEFDEEFPRSEFGDGCDAESIDSYAPGPPPSRPVTPQVDLEFDNRDDSEEYGTNDIRSTMGLDDQNPDEIAAPVWLRRKKFSI
ncbi:hypothetical protein BDN72DRAFT_299937 [Pluteus cervinus]|uniref:Uncharacterized protein n=1 Tax=Pluteus cervinus TaxID=181527 RepID=A0ACD3AES5_9AGAR|nr:hypothetical protein BDN72DRAFT_299937 [Pluteus cervinus]